MSSARALAVFVYATSFSSSSRQLDAFLTMQRTHPEETTVELYSAVAAAATTVVVVPSAKQEGV